MEAVQERDLTGSRVSHYAIVDFIGEGGMGRVYRARDERLRRDVAVKVLNEGDGSGQHRPGELMAEARALSRLSHPHVAAIYDFVSDAGRDFLIMEFVPGATLKDVVAGGPLPLAEVLRLGKQMVWGLAAAHSARVVHRDIKPGNLKVTSRGDLKILDFGLARLMPGSVTNDVSTGTPSGFGPAGTVPYMSPEQLRCEGADERSDIFSAGVVLYEMAAGRPAFPQRQLAQLIDAILHQDPIPLSTVNPFVPLPLERIVTRAMEKQPSLRYQSAAELAEALERLSTPPSLEGRTGRPGSWLAGLLG